MSAAVNLPRVTSLNGWMTTKADIDKMSEEDFIKEVEAMQVKTMVTDGMVSVVMISPELYSTFIETIDQAAVLRGASLE